MLVLALNGAGCMTLTYKAPAKPLQLAAPAKYPIAVELRLSEELREAKWEGDPGPIFVGEALDSNCEALATAMFTQVSVSRKPGPPIAGTSTLTPQLVAIARDRPAMGYNDQTTNILLLWELKDSQGRLVWVETVNGEGKAALIKANEQVDTALADLFQKSLRAMSASAEIRQLADNP